MNMLKGKIEAGGVRVDGAVLPISDGHKVPEGREVLYGVRPEHFEIAGDGLQARISVVEPTGSETTVVLRFGESEIVALFRERYDFKPGDMLHLKPRKDLVHLFDAQSGQRL
jgi:multiple sugar transport system ATP-binding protein